MYKKSVQGWLKHLDFMILDVVCLWISFTLAFNMRHGSLDVLANSLYRDMMWSLALMDIVVIFFFDSLKNVLKRGFYQEFVMTVKQTCLITLCSVFYLFTFKEAENYSRLVLGYTAALYLLISYVLRCLWKNCLRKYFGGAEKRSLLIVTVSDIVDTVIDNIKNKNYGDYFVTGVCILDKKAKGRVIDGVTVVADEDDLVEYVCREWVDEVFINIPESEPYPAELLDMILSSDEEKQTEEKNEKLPGIREGKNTGEQYLALLAYANLVPDNPLFNEEFKKNFYILEEQEKKEWEDMEAALRAAFICCDAMYCEVIANPQQAIPLEKSQFRAEELEDVLPEYKIAAGVYAPNDEIYGKFHVLLPVNEKTKRTLFELKQIYSGRWDVNERTKERIPSLPEDYLVSKEAEEILQMVDKTPARLFMMTGDAGTGKTTDARMIAQILGLPYYVFTCGPGTDELELLATTVPNMGGTAHLEMELPRLEDIEMDPASALATVNGIYEEGISREKAFQEILRAVYEKGYEKSKNEKDFLLKESEIVKACREPSVIEIQEPAMIEKPGTLTRLNSLFDDGAVTDLVNGEQIRRNPDTIVIMTTNLDYVGCQNFNQSVLSRMNLIQPKEALTEEEMAKRAMKRTGFKNKELLSFMAATVCKIHEYLIEQDITDGVCGYRELENWVLSYMVSNDLRRSAWTALLSKASMDREEQGTMERIFLLPHCDVD